MAYYEFFCPKCKQEFELKRPIDEADKPGSCPRCGTTGERLISVFAAKAGYSFKGPDKDAFRGTGTKTRPRQSKKAAGRSKKT